MITVFERRDGLVVSGTDAGKYLHSQLSNDIGSLGPGASTYAFALDPNGKVVALCRVLRVDENDYLIDVDRGAGEALLARLLRFRIRVDVAIEARELGVWCVRGAVEDVSGAESPIRGAHRVSAWWSDGTAVDFIAPLDDESASLPEDSSGELEAFRVRARWPRHGAEILTGETLAAATGVVSTAVSFTKGCYPGQELVERMDSRGATAPFVLRDIEDAGHAPGDRYFVDGVEAGRVTSVAGGRALVYVRRDLAN